MIDAALLTAQLVCTVILASAGLEAGRKLMALLHAGFGGIG